MKSLISKAIATTIAVLITLIASNQIIISSEIKQIEIIDKNIAFLSEENVQFFKSEDLAHLEMVLITGVIDGDTVIAKDMNNKEKQIRLLGINTSEVTTFNTEKECLGDEATFAMTALLRGSRFAYIQRDYTNNNQDYLGRLLRYVYIKNPKTTDETYIDLSETMIFLGYAKVYMEFPSIKKESYLEKELEAKIRREMLIEQC